MSVVVTLLIIVQTRIISNASEIKEEQFGQLVKRCLMRVASRLEEEEIKQFILSEQFAPPPPPPAPSNFSQQDPGKINQKQINFSVNFTQDPSGKVSAHTSFHESDTTIDLAQKNDFQDPNAFKTLDELNDLEQQRFLESFSNRDAYNRSLQYQLMLANKPIEQRINYQLLRTLLHQEFINNGIDLNYEFVVKSYNQGVEKIVLSSENYKSNRKKEHQTPLFMNDVGSQKPNYLKVYFPHNEQKFLGSISYMVLPTFILVALIIGIFAYTIWIIFRQKKLSTIKNDFINNMTHELKTPISTISLASQMLLDNTVNTSPSVIERISGVIYAESNRLTQQVEKVLQMAIFNEGRLKMKFKNFDMHELITSVVQNFEIRVHSDNGQITFLKNATNYTIFGDQVHITNVLFNLLDNAVKYSKENPMIEVATENIKNKLVVSVKDNGIGIAKEHQKLIFERFYRVPTGNVHDVKGFGLGLHYVFKIIEAHNGTIEVESALNKGTKFIIYFPIND
jgi:two-component system, OmpR family, phosphate regulon sensor histidine kinase PhoR